MSKKERAIEYAKARYGNNGKETQNEIAKVIACRVGYEAGWDACLEQIKQVINYQSELRDKSESMPADFAELLNEHFSELF